MLTTLQAELLDSLSRRCVLNPDTPVLSVHLDLADGTLHVWGMTEHDSVRAYRNLARALVSEVQAHRLTERAEAFLVFGAPIVAWAVNDLISVRLFGDAEQAQTAAADHNEPALLAA